MEKRKIQMTGGASYIITLPKEWITKNNIKKNDTVGVIDEGDRLIILPCGENSAGERKKVINLDEIDRSKHLFRYLVGTYIMGYTNIEITSRRRIPLDMRDVIRSFIRIAIGPEIIDETNTRVIIKDLLNPSEMPLDTTVKRMVNLTVNMHQDAIRALNDRNITLASGVIEMDIEVDRLHWLVAHQYNIFMKSPAMMASIGINRNTALFYFLISRILERIGDHAVNIASHAANIENTPGHELRKTIESAASIALKLLDDSIGSWFKRDIKLANRTRDSISSVVEACNTIEEMALRLRRTDALIMGSVTESIRRTGEYAGDICELVINHLLV